MHHLPDALDAAQLVLDLQADNVIQREEAATVGIILRVDKKEFFFCKRQSAVRRQWRVSAYSQKLLDSILNLGLQRLIHGLLLSKFLRGGQDDSGGRWR